MKNYNYILILFISLFTLDTMGQSTYYTGFDTDGERANWTLFRQGKSSHAKWSIQNGGVDSSKTLNHYAPTGAADKDSLVDWYVSPKFDFSEGGAIDSLKFNYFCFMNTFFAEQKVEIYLLAGSKDPAVASTKTLLADFASFYSGDNSLWRDTGNFIIPNTTGDCYIAFKFVATDGWSSISYDNIYITSNKVTSIKKPITFNQDIFLYPNPTIGNISLSLPNDYIGNKNLKLEIINLFGQITYSQTINPTESFLLDLPAGNYSFKLKNSEGKIIQQNKLILLE